MARRVFIIVMDSFGVGAAPDAADFGDAGANTLRSVCASSRLSAPTLQSLGLFNIRDAAFRAPAETPRGAFGRMRELSRGKDTTTGHWELAGLVSEHAMPTFPAGFPADMLAEFTRRTGYAALCGLPCSGTQVLTDFGAEHLATGALIVYTSADSVFQIAAHEDIVPREELYRVCRIAREMLNEDPQWAVGRVIARPFAGSPDAGFVRTAGRHDYSLLPPRATLLNHLSDAGRDVIGVGKISDIFAGSGLTDSIPTASNAEGMQAALALQDRDFSGLAFINLVDFDSVYGHRNDAEGYAAAVTAFDGQLAAFLPRMREEDLLIVTADHGCDPGFTATTDHTREYVPLLAAGAGVNPGTDLGEIAGFGCVAATVCDYLGLPIPAGWESLLPRMAR